MTFDKKFKTRALNKIFNLTIKYKTSDLVDAPLIYFPPNPC